MAARTPEEDAISDRIIVRGLDKRSDAVLVSMLSAVTEKSPRYDRPIRNITLFPGERLAQIDEDGEIDGTSLEALAIVAEELQFLTDKKARLLDKKFLIEQEQAFRKDGKVTRLLIVD